MVNTNVGCFDYEIIGIINHDGSFTYRLVMIFTQSVSDII